MKCNEAAEFVSALCDGERIPREAAEHIGTCRECRARLNDYVQMGLELKRIANVAEPESVPKISWDKHHRIGRSWWQLWRETMRIPRFAFALMLVVIVTLSTGLVLVGAKEKAEPIFQFQIKSPSNSNAPNGMGVTYNLSLADLSKNEGCKNDGCGLAQEEPDGMLAYVIRLLDSNDGAAKIGIRAQKFPPNPNGEFSEQERLSAIAQVRKTPENVNWYIPGQKVRIPVEGFESYEITGQLFDKIPDAINPALQPYLPKEGVMRINSPVLLQENELVYNFNGCASSVGGDGNRSDGIFLYVPGMGKFLFSPHDFAGAVEGKRSNSQVGFTSNGQSYLLLTGAPIAAGEQEGKIWVAHFPNFMPKHHQDSAACGGGPINMLVSSQQ